MGQSLPINNEVSEMMKNSPHDARQLCMPSPTDDNGRPLTYEQMVDVGRVRLGIPLSGEVKEMELEPMV